jgi:hypothetical protein
MWITHKVGRSHLQQVAESPLEHFRLHPLQHRLVWVPRQHLHAHRRLKKQNQIIDASAQFLYQGWSGDITLHFFFSGG